MLTRLVRRAVFCLAMPLACAIGLAAGPALAKCPIDRARYRMVHDGHFTAGFAPVRKYPGWPTDLALFVHSRNTGSIYWFVFDEAPESRVDLILTTNVEDPRWTPPGADTRHRDITDSGYLALDRRRVFLPGLPNSQAPPPDYILLPDLPETLWYNVSTREGVLLDFFRFDHCAEPGEL